jgi:hypothetical protein
MTKMNWIVGLFAIVMGGSPFLAPAQAKVEPIKFYLQSLDTDLLKMAPLMYSHKARFVETAASVCKTLPQPKGMNDVGAIYSRQFILELLEPLFVGTTSKIFVESVLPDYGIKRDHYNKVMHQPKMRELFRSPQSFKPWIKIFNASLIAARPYLGAPIPGDWTATLHATLGIFLASSESGQDIKILQNVLMDKRTTQHLEAMTALPPTSAIGLIAGTLRELFAEL